MAQRQLVLPAHEANRTLSNPIQAGFYQTFQKMNFDPALDQVLFVYWQLETRMATKVTFRLFTVRAKMCTSLKSI